MDLNGETLEDANEQQEQSVPELDSKYRLILIAAQRSKQLQRNARPRVQIDASKHKPTRVALEEVKAGKIMFNLKEEA